MPEYSDNWILTYQGHRFHYLNPSIDEIDIRDIAHALSLKCRFSGHCKVFYSVGEHSIRVADQLQENLKLSGLLHDAAEAYMPDVPRPIKVQFGLDKYENTIKKLIVKKYGLVSDPRIKDMDNILLATEARDFMPNMDGWAKLPEPLPYKIIPYVAGAAETIFRINFELFGGR